MNYRLLDRGETMQDGDEALTGPKDEKWEPIPHWSIGMPYRSSNNPVRRVLDVSLDAESVIERLQARIEHSAYFNGVRFARLWHWAHEELNDTLKSRFFCIVANGTADHMEQPTYAQQFNMMKHRAERAEAALRDIADDYADRFDLDSPSTNPGMKSVVQEARAVLAAAGVRVGRPLGCALAMRVMQSELYPKLDEAERADCDALVRQNLDWFKQDNARGVTDTRTCSCHPNDNPPQPCPRKFALSDCRAAAGVDSVAGGQQ